MPEIIPFGRFKNKYSVEQALLKDYKYFCWILDNVKIKKSSLRWRMHFAEYVANNFVSAVACNGPDCHNPARVIGVNYQNAPSRHSSKIFAYCSESCFKQEEEKKIWLQMEPLSLESLTMRTALSSTKGDTDGFVKVIAGCMGISQEKKHTKEDLEEIFNKCLLYAKFPGVPVTSL